MDIFFLLLFLTLTNILPTFQHQIVVKHVVKNANLCGNVDFGRANNNTHQFRMDNFIQIRFPTKRIVNGYQPKPRPFMAFLQIFDKNFTDDETTQICGGSILNKLWIVTAAHCVCSHPMKCQKETNFNYKQIRIILGVHDISIINRVDDRFKFIADKIIVHHKYNLKSHQFDLALIKVNKQIHFTNKISPICLPPSKFKDRNREKDVFAAGWGRLSGSKCTTGDHGPNPHQNCHFPYFWAGNEHNSCIFTQTPQSDICNRFFRNNLKIDVKKDLRRHGIRIQSSNGSIFNCFDPLPGRFGWCLTCNSSESNHCVGKNSQPFWGWCTKFCTNNNENLKRRTTTTTLQEVQLSTLSKSECYKYGKSLKVHSKVELCAAKRIKPRHIKTFTFSSSKSNFSLSHITKDKSIRFGGQDSCQGDSGGPLYTINHNKATLIGIISRGKGCGEKNQVGIYTRIKKFLQWIHKHISE